MENKKEFNRVLVAGCACVITSLLTYEEIERFKRLHPEELFLKDEFGDAVFAIDVSDSTGLLIKGRAEYSRMTSADGKATITVLLDPEIEDREDAVRKSICPCLNGLNALEKQLLLRYFVHRVQMVCCEPGTGFSGKRKALRDIAQSAKKEDLRADGMSGRVFLAALLHFRFLLPFLCAIQRRREKTRGTSS